MFTKRRRKADPPLWLPKDIGPLGIVSKEKTSVQILTQETTSDSEGDGYPAGVGKDRESASHRGDTVLGQARESIRVILGQGPLDWEFQRPDAKSVLAETQCLKGKRLLLRNLIFLLVQKLEKRRTSII